MNSIFKKNYNKLPIIKNYKLENNLLKIVNGGFIEKEGCFFLKELFSKQKTDNFKYFPNNFPDKVSKECFINSIHVDDYVKNSYMDYGMAFIEKVFKDWNSKYINKKLQVILSSDNAKINLKLHLVRNNEIWVDPDHLEKFKDNGIMLIDSDETNIIINNTT
jgi:hypothetical protein